MLITKIIYDIVNVNSVPDFRSLSMDIGSNNHYDRANYSTFVPNSFGIFAEHLIILNAISLFMIKLLFFEVFFIYFGMVFVLLVYCMQAK